MALLAGYHRCMYNGYANAIKVLLWLNIIIRYAFKQYHLHLIPIRCLLHVTWADGKPYDAIIQVMITGNISTSIRSLENMMYKGIYYINDVKPTLRKNVLFVSDITSWIQGNLKPHQRVYHMIAWDMLLSNILLLIALLVTYNIRCSYSGLSF